MSDPKEPDPPEDEAGPGDGVDPKIKLAIIEAQQAVSSTEQSALEDAAAPLEDDAQAWDDAFRRAEEAKAAAQKHAAAAAAQREEVFFSSVRNFAPFAIAAYCLALAALRLNFSPFLEVDEAEFVGRVDLRLIYDNAHPPLFNWLMRILLNLTGWSWADATSILRFALLGGFHYLTWSAASRVAGPRAGVAALAVSAFCPQIVWMSTHTLAHSIMVLAGAAAVLFCTLRALKKPDWKSYAWLGLAMSLGALAKFNFFLMLVPFFAAFALDRQGRRLFTQPFAWAAPAAFAATSAPSLIAAAIYVEDSGARIGKLYQDNRFAFLDLPYVGVDGFLSLIVMTLAWAGLAGLIWLGARAYDLIQGGGLADPSDDGPGGAPYSGAMIGRILERALLGGLGLFAVLILAGDVTKIEERYLTPLLALLPVYLAVRWPLTISARPVALLAIVAYLAVFPGYWGYVTYGKHRFAIPYDAVAAQIRRQYPEALPLISPRHDDQANIVLALGWPGATTPRYQPVENDALLVWRGRGVAPASLEPQGFGPASPITTVAVDYRNSSGREEVYSFQRYVRTAP